MLNFFNFKRFGNDYLLTNDTGKHMFVSDNVFNSIVEHKNIPDETLEKLKERYPR